MIDPVNFRAAPRVGVTSALAMARSLQGRNDVHQNVRLWPKADRHIGDFLELRTTAINESGRSKLTIDRDSV